MPQEGGGGKHLERFGNTARSQCGTPALGCAHRAAKSSGP